MSDLTTLERARRYLGLVGKPVTNITQANPGVVTCVGHDLVSNTQVALSGVGGMTELNDKVVTVTVIDADNLSIGVDTTTYGVYTSGGQMSAYDVVLVDLLKDCSLWLLGEMGREALLETEYTETRSGDGGNLLRLYQQPVVSVTSLTVDGETIPQRQTVGTGESGWVLVGDQRLVLDGWEYVFTRGVGNVVVVYRAGFAAVPEDIASATTELVAWRYRMRDRLGLRSRTAGGESVTYMVDAMSDNVRRTIERYRTRLV